MARDGTPSGGRPKGSKSKKTVIREQIAAVKGKTPLDVMLDAMEYFLGKADKATDEAEKDKLKRLASQEANQAAPYVHSKMPQGVQVQGTINLTFGDKRDEKL